MNYVPVAVGTTSNDSASTQEDLNVGQEGANKDCIVMPIWKDASYFNSSTKDVDNDEPKSVADDPNLKDDNTAGQQLNTANPGVNTGSPEVNTLVSPVHTANPKYMQGASHSLEATHIEFFSDEDKPEIEIGNIPNSYSIPTTPHTRIHKDHPLENVIGDVQSSVQTRRSTSEQGFLSAVYDEKTHEELNNFARIEAIRLFLAYASFMGFLVYQMDVKSTFLYGTIEEEVYVCQPPGFEDPDKVYKVAKAYSGKWVSYHALGQLFVGKWVSKREDRSNIKELCSEFEKLMKDKFQMSSMGELTFFLGLQVKQREDGIFISQDKYVADILRKFNYTDVKTASATMDLKKPLVKDGDDKDVDVHLYRSMIGSLMYLTTSRLDIMFAAFGFELVAYSDSDYVGATQDRKSTTGGCQLLGNRLISWQCKKQTVVATSTTEAEYVVAANCCGQVLWIQNQLLDYGYNFMNTVIHIDNNNLFTKGFDAGRFQYLVSSSGPSVHSHGSDEGRMQQTKFTDLVTKLSNRIDVLEKDLQHTKKTYSTAITTLVLRVKKLEKQVKTGKARRRARIVLSEDEDATEDSSKQGRKISDIDEDPNIILVQEKQSVDTEVLIEEEEPTKLVKDQGSGEKGQPEVKTARAELSTGKDRVSTASEIPDVNTASQVDSTVGIKAKDKGKGIMQESEPSKKVKKRVQIQMGMDQEIAKKLFEDKQARFNAEQEARAKREEEQEQSDFEITQELQKQLDSIDWNTVAEQLQKGQSDTIKRYQTLKKKPVSVAQARKNMMIFLKNMARYKMNYFKGMSYDDIRPIFEMEYNKMQTLFKNRDQ
ncbi:putative ribonuclease H-like domain-containing protein [Tanacetum coccineum]|uniref:Ribonuclease H-like domain-containing protein n=1 Tax=Tanacetum coccineum TaxID=301880 RepID=A0ABQ5HDB6_9ASTR